MHVVQVNRFAKLACHSSISGWWADKSQDQYADQSYTNEPMCLPLQDDGLVVGLNTQALVGTANSNGGMIDRCSSQ